MKNAHLEFVGGLSISALFALPLSWAVLGSLRSEGRFGTGTFTWQHYQSLVFEPGLWQATKNSLLVASATTVIALTLGASAAYALSRLRFRGRSAVLGGLLAASAFPQIALVGPLYLGLRRLGLIDTTFGLILTYSGFALPLAVWVMVAFFRRLPKALEEAAFVDGAPHRTTLVRILLPLALPGFGTAGLLTFVFCYNEFLFASSFTVGQESHTLPVAISLLRGQYQIPWGRILAAAVLATVPIGLLAAFFGRRLQTVLTGRAV